ncbi:MAG: hypothetical protein Q8O55_06570 [Dehalococcoidales bacterium]|nr:hypothetical protein [Dehalococcoidales bacterium]
MTPEEARVIFDKIDRIEDMVSAISGDIKVLKMQAHSPLDCPIRVSVEANRGKIDRLGLSEARLYGVMATIGVVVSIISTVATMIISKLWR